MRRNITAILGVADVSSMTYALGKLPMEQPWGHVPSHVLLTAHTLLV